MPKHGVECDSHSKTEAKFEGALRFELFKNEEIENLSGEESAAGDALGSVKAGRSVKDEGINHLVEGFAKNDGQTKTEADSQGKFEMKAVR